MANILFVCTANLSRSPAAEAIARSRFGAGDFGFDSAGFLFEGRPIEPAMANALDAVGVSATGHRSKKVDPSMLASADLVLTMEVRHLQDLCVMSDEAFARTIPLAEAAERLWGRRVPLSHFIGELADRTPLTYLDDRWDIEDPYKGSKRKHRKAVEQISALVDIVLSGLDAG